MKAEPITPEQATSDSLPVLCPTEYKETEEQPTHESLEQESNDVKTSAETEVSSNETSVTNSSEEPNQTNPFPLKFLSVAALSAVTCFFAAVTVFSLILSGNLNSESVISFLVGDIYGGRENVIYTTPSKTESTAHSDETKESVPETAESESESETEAEKSDKPYSVTLPLALSNETPYAPDMNAILAEKRDIPPLSEYLSSLPQYSTEEYNPVVLILHTHATEAYSGEEKNDFRSDDNRKNVVSIGKEIKKVLEKNGIEVLHLTEQFDSPDFGMAYYNAALAIKESIREYPSIAYIIDVHRDSVLLPDGTYYPATAKTKEGDAAEIMFVVGTDHGGSDHSEWEKNLSLAARLQYSLLSREKGIARNINLRSASFNEQYRSGSLLVEIGSNASTHSEAVRGAVIFAESLAEEILGITSET